MEKHITELLRGERPEGMDYKEFRVKRLAIQKFLKNRWRMFHEGPGQYIKSKL